MWREVLRFELRQQLRAPLFWVVSLAFALLAFAFITTDAVSIGGGMGNVHRNAPIVIIRMLAVFSILGMFLVTMFVAGAALRDFDQRSEEMVFATPVSKGAYLGGRFGAGYLTALAVMVITALGLLIGSFMPWLEAARLGPTSMAGYGWAFGVIVIPDLVLIAAMLFLLATTTRSLLATYIGIIAFFVLSAISNNLLSNLNNHTIAGLLDPFGMRTISLATRYWSVDQLNHQLPQLSGVLLANRLIWLTVAVALLAAAFALFRTDREGLRLPWRRRRKADAAMTLTSPARLDLPKVSIHDDRAAHWRQFFTLARFDTSSVLRGAAFLVMLVLGLANLTGAIALSGKIFGTSTYPVTHVLLTDMRGSFQFLLWIILTFYAGELVWRERSKRTNEVSDAFPTPDWVSLAAKFTALVAVIVTFFAVGAIWCIGWQLLHGFTHIEPMVYVKTLAFEAIPFVLIAILAVFLQVLANSKFLGYLLLILYFAGQITFGMMHLDSNMYSYAGAPSVPYSDMNGFGHFWVGALWFYGYWAWLALALLVASALFWVRGTGHTWALRKREALARLRRPERVTLTLALVGFVLTGAWVFYNTHILNAYVASDTSTARQASYEKTYAKYRHLPQPRITAVQAHVDIYPYQRRLHIKGHYTLVNKHDKPIDTLHMRLDSLASTSHLTLNSLTFPAHTVVKKDAIHGVTIYKLDKPLAPGASMSFDFDETYAPKGFTNGTGETFLVHNGTFFNNTSMFPQFGYDANRQITDRSKRRKYGLSLDVPRMPLLSEDPARRANTYISHDADWIRFDTTVCTAADQTAMAPGQLKREWSTGKHRHCFHYAMDQPMLNFFAYLSARYAVKKATWHGINIAVYYNPAHYWNVERMIEAVEKAFAYYNSHFTPYQFKQLRILEFPDYASFAQSFANTVPFSESIGFIADLQDKDNLDYVFDVTAHEVAHQWWAHRVIGADMQGSTMLSESLAQYSSLMVIKHQYGARDMRRFLKYELDRYLAGRATEQDKEEPLAKVENQPYIHYRKGSMVFYALQDYIGEDKLDGMLKQFLIDKGFQNPPYTNSIEFMDALEKTAGPEWKGVLDDWFWKITLYDNRVISATAHKANGGGYDVTMKVHASKSYSDGEGKETKGHINLPIDIGIFARAKDGKEADEKILYLEKRKLADGDSTITLHVDGKPYEVGIDPYNELIDRVSSDNRMKVTVE
ncbi:M1 family aminopeptidase [Oleiagrimonas sp.]|jgi:ABC-2 type transport system permease protein|uniref:ABC transporter permease/M1 family aminopeptidase n=1 Tax=Oleiagrimonas sp. TaxID=2010330 RepID=UPI002638BF42|nr:M1 family aminopeptidase [Oleiagrimonas sp.]MDA3915246.1 M1 family aminopeptidase [Oleiagrimonas sp.]